MLAQKARVSAEAAASAGKLLAGHRSVTLDRLNASLAQTVKIIDLLEQHIDRFSRVQEMTPERLVRQLELLDQHAPLPSKGVGNVS
jgi:hypothetical protein